MFKFNQRSKIIFREYSPFLRQFYSRAKIAQTPNYQENTLNNCDNYQLSIDYNVI